MPLEILRTKLFGNFPGPVLTAMKDGHVTAINPQANGLAEMLANNSAHDLRKLIRQATETGDPAHIRCPASSGSSATVFDLTVLPLSEPDGTVLILGRDVTMERNLTQALLASRQLFKDLVQCSSDFAWETSASGHFSYVSARGALGYEAAELNGRLADDFLLNPPTPSPFRAPIAVENNNLLMRAKNGETICYEVNAVPITTVDGTFAGARGVCRDVTLERQREADLEKAHALLEKLARSDELTGLLNRRAFLAETGRRLAQQKRHRRPAALIFLDLDNFKPINDIRGHHAGDDALRAFATLLATTSRVGDVAARFGGDEFAVWLEDTDEAGAQRKTETLLAAMSALDQTYGAPGLPFSLSAGIVISNGDESLEMLLAGADQAMYRAKRSGKGSAAVARSAA